MRRSLLIASILGLALRGYSARAQVLTIDEAGAVTVLAGPAVTTRDGVKPIITAAPTTVTGARISGEIAAAAVRYGIDGRLARAVAAQESGMRQEVRSPKGALGVMQLTPATAHSLGVDPTDLVDNINGGVAYLSKLLQRFGGDVRLALAAYNAGPAAVDRYGGVPPYIETRSYVQSVLGRVSAVAFAPPPLGTGP